ncbi:MAG: hypothetical protein HGA65_02730 [Oscillochloris sp.]|nr:hypothetical protein [Oscillochloris sp.]
MHTLTLPRSPYLAGRHLLLALLALLATLGPLAWRAGAPATSVAPAQPAAPALGALPLIIVPTGSAAAPFSALIPGSGASFRPDSLALHMGEDSLTVRFLGARPDVALTAADQRQGTINSRIGSDPAGWREGVPTYAAVEYRGLFPGISLRYDGSFRQFKGTYTLAPFADPTAIRWRYEGAQRVQIDPDSGDLQITMPGGTSVREQAPLAWQDIDGRRVPVAARFQLEPSGVASFALSSYDSALPLVIDPTLSVSSFLGGGSADYGRGVGVDGQGNIYVVGDFFSSDFLGFPTTTKGSKDVIVLKLNPAANDLVYGWYEGGSETDEGLAIAVNPQGEAYVLVDPGADFPVQGGPVTTPPSAGDGILMKFSASGAAVYSTYIGFGLSNIYTGQALAFDVHGVLYVTGESYQAAPLRRKLAVARINPTSGQVITTFKPGLDYDGTRGAAIVMGYPFTIYVVGTVDSRFASDFPTTPDAVQPICGRQLALGADRDCDADAFVMVLESDMSVLYASYLGGNGTDEGRGLVVDAQGNMTVVGTTFSADFPLKNPLIAHCPVEAITGGCSYDSFATRLSQSAGLIYSTYITSGEPEAQTFATDVALDSSGNAYVYGFGNGAHMPLKDAIQHSRGDGFCSGWTDRYCFDTFITGLSPDGRLVFGSYLGGTYDEYSGGMTIDSGNNLYLAGYSESADYPTTAGVIQPARSVGNDFFVAKIALGVLTPGPGPNPQPDPDLPYKAYLPLIVR